MNWTQIKWKFVYLNSRQNPEVHRMVCKNELQVVVAVYFDFFEVWLHGFYSISGDKFSWCLM